MKKFKMKKLDDIRSEAFKNAEISYAINEKLADIEDNINILRLSTLSNNKW